MLLENSQSSVACRTSSYACKTYSGKVFSFTAVSSEGVCRRENWLENCSERRKFVTETTPKRWMRTLQHSCCSKLSHIGYLPLSRELSRILLSDSANSPLKEWAKHLNFKKWEWEYCLVTWAHKAVFWRKEKISAMLLLKVVVLLENRIDIPKYPLNLVHV